MAKPASLSEQFITLARHCLPTPFSIAVVLTLLTMLLAWGLTPTQPVEVLQFWETGFWDLLTFAMQMMLMLVLGHVLALTKPVAGLMKVILRFCTSTARAAAIVTFFTVLVGLLNWGLGLIFGAILASKVGEAAAKQKQDLNYPLIGAAGYSGLMVWHGGLSGSAPIKVAEADHFLVDQMGQLPLSETIFSPMNVTVSLALLILLPIAMGVLGSTLPGSDLKALKTNSSKPAKASANNNLTAAGQLDHHPGLAWLFGGLVLGVALLKGFQAEDPGSLSFLTPNFINFVLFGLGLVLFGSIQQYITALEEAIVGATGIMIQFPLYAGIAGIIKYSGLITVFSDGILTLANQTTFPLFTLVSAGVVNVFVPSGGGQWAVQGPIIIEAAEKLNIPIAKCVMAMAYGDQLTNMIQPFWALPLLGITKLTAQEILPFTLYLMVLGLGIYTAGLLVF